LAVWDHDHLPLPVCPADYWLGISGSGDADHLAIAQALLKNAPVLVLDEATANLDVETEREILESIYELTADRTLVVISHRPEVLSGMDAALTLRDGRLEELAPKFSAIRWRRG
jgi:ABC-type transport system involved in cytochrome bd biosynthesis fused ATPase/permease subunit